MNFRIIFYNKRRACRERLSYAELKIMYWELVEDGRLFDRTYQDDIIDEFNSSLEDWSEQRYYDLIHELPHITNISIFKGDIELDRDSLIDN